MFIFLSKKIAVPNNLKLQCLDWNSEQGYIACGGQEGLLKVLRLEAADPNVLKSKADMSGSRGIAAPSNLTMNQTLEGHHGAVMCVTWNASFKKLTTSDEDGLIIVWVMHRGMWYEEMINNRNKSVVRDMKWTTDGEKICIAYEDGAVIVGSVDGNRLWGKDMKTQLEFVEWAPDSKTLLFVSKDGEVAVHDAHGNKQSTVNLYAVEADSLGYRNTDSYKIVGLHWYDGLEGHICEDVPTLAIAFRDGKVQVTRGRFDSHPVLIDTGLELSRVRWNNDGSVLALAGSQKIDSRSGKEGSMVQFYDPFGRHLRSLRVPGSKIEALAWDGSGLRICLAIDSYIYFANVRPDYKWGFFAENTVVYTFNRVDQAENCVVFWDTKSSGKYVKYHKNLLGIKAAGDNCVLVTQIYNETTSNGVTGPEDTTHGSSAPSKEVQYQLLLCDTIGSPIESKIVDFEPLHVCMTPRHIIAASSDAIFVWQYRNSNAKLTGLISSGPTSTSGDTSAISQLLSQTGGSVGIGSGNVFGGSNTEKIFYVDETQGNDVSNFHYMERNLEDPICAICASDSWIVAARTSGLLHFFTLPHISLEMKHLLQCRPQKISLNCNSTRLSVIDINGIMTLVEVGSPGSLSVLPAETLDFERKDAWDMLWADDNPELFVVMEKARMFVFRGLDSEEPLPSSGYLCSYKELQVKAALLDEILVNPDEPSTSMLLTFNTRSLREAKELLDSAGISDASNYIQEHPHPRLWKLLAEAALEQLDFITAERGFVKCQDYGGVHYVKRLQRLNDRTKQKAEVAAYFQRFDEADELYRQIDRKDLAIELRERLGDWFRVVQLAQANGGSAGADDLLKKAYSRIGDQFADKHEWQSAIKYYSQAGNNEALVSCYYKLGDFNQLESIVSDLPESSPLLKDMAIKFTQAGISRAAAETYIRMGDIKGAIDACVLLNEWEQAVALAETHSFPQIENILAKYASSLLASGKIMQAIELYRRAHKSSDAAKLLSKLAKEACHNPLRAKKLQVLAAFEVERMRKKMLDQTTALMTSSTGAGSTSTRATAAQMTAQTLDTLVQHDAATGENKSLDNPWRGAEAYHLYLLAHRQLYAGHLDRAMRTSLKLRVYEDVLDERDVFSLAALTAFYTNHFAQCSNAMIKLETMHGVDEADTKKMTELALSIFSTTPPKDPSASSNECPSCRASVQEWDSRCDGCGRQFQTCMATGATVLDERTLNCRTCRHVTIETEAKKLKTCPLCHAPWSLSL